MPEEAPNSARHTYCRLSIKSIVRCAGSVFVPLLLAIFTVVITFEQRGEGHQQRMQDMNASREQREQDKWIAEKQRDHDKKLADEKRHADDINAEKQRNMSRDQREHELEIEQQRYEQEREKYLNNLLLSYYNEIGQSLKESNGTLSSNPIISALARAKTLNVIEQVGPKKAVYLIEFLYDANQLSLGAESLDLTDAQLNNIDLSSVQTLRNVYFIGAYLNNASFAGKDLSNAHFLNVQLQQANFSRANISFTIFKNVDLSQATFKDASGTDMYFEYCSMEGVDFSNVHFDANESSNSARGFRDTTLTSSSFRNAALVSIQFLFCNMTAVDFSCANLKKADLTGSLLSFSLFRNAQLQYTEFLSTNLSYADLRNSSCLVNSAVCKLWTTLSLKNALLPDGKMSETSDLLIQYGHPQCNSSIHLPDSALDPFKWSENPPDSVFLEHRTLTYSHLYTSGCVFTAKSDILTQVNLTYIINLSNYMGLVHARRAKATVRCRVGDDTHVTVTQLTSEEIELSKSHSIGLRWQDVLNQQTENVVISIEFRRPYIWQSTWCLYIEFFVESMIQAPGYQLLYPWDSTDL